MSKIRIKFSPEKQVEFFTESGEKIECVTSLEVKMSVGQPNIAYLSILDPEIEGEVEANTLILKDFLRNISSSDLEEFEGETVNYG